MVLTFYDVNFQFTALRKRGNMTEKYREALVSLHNKFCILQALGHIIPYEPAVRMAKVRWNPVLAALAELNVRNCLFEHDSCHDTGKLLQLFKNSLFEYFTYLHFLRNVSFNWSKYCYFNDK